MFTPVEIEEAFRKIFGMYNQEKVKLLKFAFKEEIENISPEHLAWEYSNSAVQPHEYREMLSVDEPGDWQGLPLLDQKAALVAEYLGTRFSSERMHVIQIAELWLLEDMTFASILCTEIYEVEKDVFQNRIECRAFLTFVEESSDIPVDEESLIYALNDTSTFEQVE